MDVDELQQELDTANTLISELQLRLTEEAADQSRRERNIWETARRTAERQVRERFDQHWAIALAEARNPLTGLIHHVRNLGPRPKKAQIDALAAAAELAAEALDRGKQEADQKETL